MDHAEVAEKGLIDLYHRGALPPEEEARFEEHFVACGECQAALEMARGLQRGLKAAAAEDARAAVAAGLLAWLARRGRLAQWGLALGGIAVLAVALAGLPGLWRAVGGEGERPITATTGTETPAPEDTTAAAWRERFESERRSAAELERRLAASERQREAERRELKDRLAQAERPDQPAGALPRPLANTPVVLLSAFRDEPGGPPAAIIDLGAAGEAVALAVDVGDDPRFESYRVTVAGPRDERLFRRDGLRPNDLEVLMITFPTAFFAPGVHRLSVEGLRPDGAAVDLGSYPFRVVAAVR